MYCFCTHGAGAEMAMMIRGRSQRQRSVSEMIAMLDVHSMMIDAPSTSVRQNIDVERLEDEIVSGATATTGSSAITLAVASTDKIAAALSDYDTVSEQVYLNALFISLFYFV